jgi:hypothetical protein
MCHGCIYAVFQGYDTLYLIKYGESICCVELKKSKETIVNIERTKDVFVFVEVMCNCFLLSAKRDFGGR